MIEIVRAHTDSDLRAIRALFREYDGSLNVDLSFQGIDQEIATLPGKYAPPRGALLLTRDIDGQALGGVAVRPFERPGACEVKRLYVRPAGRGRGLGRLLMREAIAFAREAGYRDVLLDSLSSMTAAVAVYRGLGFAEIPPYWNNPLPGAMYFGKRLG